MVGRRGGCAHAVERCDAEWSSLQGSRCDWALMYNICKIPLHCGLREVRRQEGAVRGHRPSPSQFLRTCVLSIRCIGDGRLGGIDPAHSSFSIFHPSPLLLIPYKPALLSRDLSPCRRALAGPIALLLTKLSTIMLAFTLCLLPIALASPFYPGSASTDAYPPASTTVNTALFPNESVVGYALATATGAQGFAIQTAPAK